MSHYVDTPIAVDPITKQDIVDAKQEHDQQLYKSTLDQVEENYLHKLELGLIDEMPSKMAIHNEAIAILKEIYK